MVNTIQVGNSARYTATFYDFDNQIVEPDAGTITFKATIQGAATPEVSDTLTGTNKLGTGQYWAIFTPEASGAYDIEFAAEIGGVPVLVRKRIGVSWI